MKLVGVSVTISNLSRIEEGDTAVVFWNHKTGEKNYKFVSRLIGMASAGSEHCVLVTGGTGSPAGVGTQGFEEEDDPALDGQGWNISVCNALGTPIDTKQVTQNPDFSPQWVTATSTHAFVASKDAFMAWQFRNAKSWNSTTLRSVNQSAASGIGSRGERAVHIDDSPSGGLAAGVVTNAIIRKFIFIFLASSKVIRTLGVKMFIFERIWNKLESYNVIYDLYK